MTNAEYIKQIHSDLNSTKLELKEIDKLPSVIRKEKGLQSKYDSLQLKIKILRVELRVAMLGDPKATAKVNSVSMKDDLSNTQNEDYGSRKSYTTPLIIGG